MANIPAASGNASAIQAAVNQASVGDVVVLPVGTFDFVPVGGWNDYSTKVIVPAGVSIVSAGLPTMGSAWGGRFPSACATVLKLPYDVPSGSINTYNRPQWFSFEGEGNPSLPVTRFSGIELRGYRYYDHTSTYINHAVSFWQITNFLMDHCIVQDVVGGCGANGGETVTQYPTVDHACCGVFAHNVFRNTLGYMDAGMYDNLTVCYGIQPLNFNSRYWDPNISNVMGRYTSYSVYMEDNYFEKWRHCISAGSGIHAVFRHNVVEHDYANGSVDVHGQGLSYLGGRCLEVYENDILNSCNDAESGAYDWNKVWHNNKGWSGTGNNVAINHRGGAGAIWNNRVDASFPTLVVIEDEEPSHEGGYTEDLYIWGNVGTQQRSGSSSYSPILRAPTNAEVVDYANNIALYGSPYTYPHPLVNGGVVPTNPRLQVQSSPSGIQFTLTKM